MLVWVTTVLLVSTLLSYGETRECICATTLDASGLNIRSCGSTDCDVVGWMADGECADYLGQSDGSWVYIDFRGTVNTERK